MASMTRLDGRPRRPQIPRMIAAPFRLVLVICALLAAPASGVRAEINLLSNDKLIEAVKANDYRTVEELLTRGHDANVSDENGRTSLMLAAASGYEDVAEVLVRNRAGLNAADKFGNSALYYAAASDNVGVIQILKKAGANINILNREGATPLMVAAAEGHIAAIHALLDAKADLSLTDYTGRTARDWAERNRRSAALRVLDRALEAGSGPRTN